MAGDDAKAGPEGDKPHSRYGNRQSFLSPQNRDKVEYFLKIIALGSPTSVTARSVGISQKQIFQILREGRNPKGRPAYKKFFAEYEEARRKFLEGALAQLKTNAGRGDSKSVWRLLSTNHPGEFLDEKLMRRIKDLEFLIRGILNKLEKENADVKDASP